MGTNENYGLKDYFEIRVVSKIQCHSVDSSLYVRDTVSCGGKPPYPRTTFEEKLIHLFMDNINTRENLFNIVKIHNRTVQVYFIPGSDDFTKLGQYITVIDLNDPDNEILNNISNKKHSIGNVELIILNLEDELENMAVSVNTENIREIAYL